MKAISYTALRNSLAKFMEKVCKDCSPLIVTRQNADSVVLLSLADYEALVETAYLLQSPKNAARLAESVAQIESGKAKAKKIAA